MSLYPNICKYFKFYIGHPIIHVGDVCRDMDAMLQNDGLMMCSILPPTHLYHPVLPFRCNNRLLICLCRSCALEQNRTSACTHETVAERALIGTWVLDEIWLAVQKGNRLVKVYEVYEYQVTRYDRQTGDDGLIAQYIDTFLKLKAEASGYADWVHSPEDRDRYVSEFNTTEGVALNKEAIRPNTEKTRSG
jgi:hypothetical protein